MLFVQIYGCRSFPVIVHKNLSHGADIDRHFDIAPGRLTEQASEARNKDVRRFLAFHVRRFKRLAADRDLLNNLLITSDPLINSVRNVKLKNSKYLFPKALQIESTDFDK
jgi:type II secretory pathway component HofQ